MPHSAGPGTTGGGFGGEGYGQGHGSGYGGGGGGSGSGGDGSGFGGDGSGHDWGSGSGGDGYAVRSAPYALVRATVLRYPAQGPPAAAFRTELARLAALEAETEALLPELCDDLYAGRGGHPETFHRDVVLPLRRALHNRRDPRPALLDRLGDLPARVPRLATWLVLRNRRAALLTALAATADAALAAEREALSALCRDPALRRAVALTSSDLLRAVERAGTGAVDRKARKEEAGVLRHALRASTKTSPLSWFTAVGWGPLPGAASEHGLRAWGNAGPRADSLTSVVKANRTLVSALSEALLDDARRRAGLPHRMTSSARVANGRAAYARSRVVFAGGRYLVTTEDEIALTASGPLELIASRCEKPAFLEELADALNTALNTAPGSTSGDAPRTASGTARGDAPRTVPGNASGNASRTATGHASGDLPRTAVATAPGDAPRTAPGTAGDGAAATAFLDRLTEAGLLVPTEPVDPQDEDPLARLARWLRAEPGGGSPGSPGAPNDAALADRIDVIARETREFAAAEPTRRPALLAGLSARWHTLLSEAGRPVPQGAAPLNVLSEDVVAPDPVRLDGLLDSADHEALSEVTALAELFDLGHLMRRITRDRFVARYGSGGTCRHPWEFGAEVAEAWEEAGRLAALAPRDQDRFPSGGAELAALRRALIEAAHGAARGAAHEAGAGNGGAHGTENGAPGAQGEPAAYGSGDDAAGQGTQQAGTAAPRDPGDPAHPDLVLPTDPADPDVVLPPDLIRELGARLPRWMVQRPLSYSYFLQRGTSDDGLLCVNHVYGGWGRFTSRFLDALPSEAGAGVARQIRRGLGEEARAAQVRPVGGFNANLHPLLVPDEIGPDRRWTSIGEPEVDLVHDETSDQIRLRLRATGELLDVLYDGFLAPIMLPRRIAPLLSDHPNGVVDFRSLVPRSTTEAPGGKVIRTPRLRHRHLVLLRRRWHLAAGVVQALRADLTAEQGIAAAATARWRTLLDLPEQLFLHPAPAVRAGPATEDFLTDIGRPKPQFVDLGNALHLRSLAKWLSRHPGGAVLEEALPAPGGQDRATQAVELVVENYRAGQPS